MAAAICQRRRLLCIFISVVCVFIVFYILKSSKVLGNLLLTKPAKTRPIKFKSLFGCPTLSNNELESVKTTKMNIPFIVHQIYRVNDIPREFPPLIQGCQRINPDFVFLIWTESFARKFVKKNYPQYDALFSKYRHGGPISDFVRVLALYHFGGAYLDMDVECRKPFSVHLDKFSAGAIVDQERPIQTRMRWNINNTAMNAVMMSRKKHPFYKYLLEKFPVGLKHKNVLWKTGPFYFNDRLKEYNKQKRTELDRVHMVSPFTFSPLLDPGLMSTIDIICTGSYENFAPLRRLGCLEWDRQGRNQDNIPELIKNSIVVHRFMDLAWNNHAISDRVDICSLPNIFKPPM